MSTARHHADWLSLVEVSGPFVSLPVLLRTFPQGLEARDPAQAKQLRAGYEDWQDNPAAPGKQRAWVLHVLSELLGYPANQIAEGQALPAGLEANMAEQGETLRPDFALIGLAGSDAVGQAQLLINSYPAAQPLDKPVIGKHWKATPATRMMELLHGTNVPLGLVTNGEQWMLVYAPRGETTGYASWYGALWLDEPITLRAFLSLLGVRRFFGVAADSTLLALLKESASDQQEVTDQLGYQVREAVEVLVQSFDAIHQESQGAALKGVPPAIVYDAALTIMMRLVFLFSAEERGLLHLGKPLYDNNYAVSTLQEQLQEVADQNGEEVLERRHDAWTRLLATFRAVHGGIQHQDLLMQAYGGSLFDPDRYPFLEGRAAGTTWRSQPADPMPVNNRVVLHLLNSLQRLRTKTGGAAETRRVSFRALGVEQIGHVYEGLLDHTTQRATEVVLGIRGTRSKEHAIPLSTLEQLLNKGENALLELLKEETGRSLPALRKELNNVSVFDEHKLLVACRQDEALLARLRPFAGLIREDSFERPWVVLPGSVFVTAGTTRRSTGTHYTPPSLTEPIVRHTLEPLVYVGPAEGLPKEEWKLKPPKVILALKVCDMAMGSGAFLVQACRYLAERLVEAWENEEKTHPGQVLITPDGKFSEGVPTERLVPAEPAERIAIARRVVADRCLYGVDINPMAVEMAKLSMWLITVDKNRPFTFLDHAFKCGDSLLGITSLEQLENFSLRPGAGKLQGFNAPGFVQQIEKARKKREMLESMPSDTPEQIAAKAALHSEAEDEVAKLNAAADLLVAIELKGLKGRAYGSERESAADHLMVSWSNDLDELSDHSKQRLGGRICMHWALEFPEIVGCNGFDGFIGNPPFLGGRRISFRLGDVYYATLQSLFPWAIRTTDLCVYFLRRTCALLKDRGVSGLLLSDIITQGDSREAGIASLCANGYKIVRAKSTRSWPGTAGVKVVDCHFFKGEWKSKVEFDSVFVAEINSYFLPESERLPPHSLLQNQGISFSGHYLGGQGFLISQKEAEELIRVNSANSDVIFDYIKGDELNNTAEQSLELKAIYFAFRDLPEIEAKFPEALKIVRERVKPERNLVKRDTHRERWWRYADARPALADATKNLDEVLLQPYTAKYVMPSFYRARCIFAHPMVVIADPTPARFAAMQSSFHTLWVWSYCATNLDLLAYTADRVFGTFPFPNSTDELNEIGRRYSEIRDQVRLSKSLALTEIYNRIHDSSDSDTDIVEMRSQQVELDRVVSNAYGWQTLDLGHGFHETKQGIRFTISDVARREVLDRLLALNHQRHAEEVAAGLHEKKSSRPTQKRKVAVAAEANLQDDLFGQDSTVSNPACQSASGHSPIVEYLRARPGWHSKDDILSATNFPENRWNVAIRDLLDNCEVHRQGEKRGAKYRAAPKDDT